MIKLYYSARMVCSHFAEYCSLIYINNHIHCYLSLSQTHSGKFVHFSNSRLKQKPEEKLLCFGQDILELPQRLSYEFKVVADALPRPHAIQPL